MTASKFNRLPSELVGIADPEIAFAFNVECAEILLQSDLDREAEKEQRQIEAMGEGMLTNALTGRSPRVNIDRSNAVRW